ncbi:MAG: zf-HC2 domain-containing protein [Nitrospirota bacterium]
MKPDTLLQREQHPLALLAFYVNGTLAGPDLDDVEAHLSACPSCRREAEEWEELAFAVREEPGTQPDSSRAWERLERRIEEERGRPAREARGFWSAAGRSWWRSPSLAWGLAAVQFVLVVGLVVYLAAVRPGGTAWTTLGGPVPSTPEGVRLQVIFQGEAAADEIAELLTSVDGQIVSGPTAQGVYVVAIVRGERTRVESAVTLLQSRPDVVRWVQHETQ